MTIKKCYITNMEISQEHLGACKNALNLYLLHGIDAATPFFIVIFHIDPVARFESCRALKLSRLENFRALKLSRLENFRALKP